MKVVAIGGCSGSGKTHLARALLARLGGCVAIGLDAYYRPLAELTLEERARRNYDHPDALEWELLQTHLRTLARGQAVEAPVYLFDQHTRAAETRIVRAADAVIIEGILALHHVAVRELAQVKVFVETNESECLRRRLARDIQERGRTERSVLEQYQSTVLPMAREFVLPSRTHADLVISGEQPVEAAVQEIVARLGLA